MRVKGSESAGSLRSILAHRPFSLWLGSRFACNVGYSAWAISVLWLAYQISGTLLLSALVLFVQYGIYSLTAIAGPFADRAQDKRTVFLIVFPLQAITAVLVGVLLAFGSLSAAALLAAVAVISFLDDFWWLASNMVPRILLGTDNLLRANGVQATIGSAGSLAGYALGALLLTLIGPEGGAFLRGMTSVISALLLLPVAIPSVPTAARSLFRSFIEGWSLLWRQVGRSLLKVAALFAACGFFDVTPPLLITLFANREFGGSSFDYGLFFTSYMVGVIASGLVVGRANPRRYIGIFLVLAMVASGATIALAVMVLHFLAPSIGIWFLVGLASGVPPTLVYAYFQATAPPDAVGRVVSNLESLMSPTGALGAIALGILAAVLSPPSLGYTVALGFIGVGLVAFAFPTARRMGF